MENNKPTLWRIFQTDYPTAVSGTLILVLWGFFVFFRIVQPTGVAELLFYVSIVVTVAGAAVLAWRIRLIQSTFENGVEVDGSVLAIRFYRDRGYVSYAYDVNGERIQSSNAIAKYRTTEQLKAGQKVRVVADRNNPKIAFIKNIYL